MFQDHMCYQSNKAPATLDASLRLNSVWWYLSVLKHEFEYIQIISPSELREGTNIVILSKMFNNISNWQTDGRGLGKTAPNALFQILKWQEVVVKSIREDFSIHSLFRVKTWEMIRIVFKLNSVLNSVPAQQVKDRTLKTTRSEFDSQETHIIKSL